MVIAVADADMHADIANMGANTNHGVGGCRPGRERKGACERQARYQKQMSNLDHVLLPFHLLE